MAQNRYSPVNQDGAEDPFGTPGMPYTKTASNKTHTSGSNKAGKSAQNKKSNKGATNCTDCR